MRSTSARVPALAGELQQFGNFAEHLAHSLFTNKQRSTMVDLPGELG